jgi:hypothetical protein
MRRRKVARWLLRHTARPHRDSQLVQIGLGAPGIPCWAEVVGRSRRLFGWDFVCGGQWTAVYDSNKLVFGPGVFVVVEPFPEWSKSSFDLVWCELLRACQQEVAHTCSCRTAGLL